MEIIYKKDINHTYVLFQGENIDTQVYQVQMALHNLIEGILPCSVISINQNDVWRCDCTGMQSLEKYCQNRELKKSEFIWIIESLLENIQELQSFLLDVDSIYLMPGEIYISPQEKRIFCCIVPFYKNPIWNSLGQLFQFLLRHLDAKDNTLTALAYGCFRVLSSEDCSMEKLWTLLYEKKKNVRESPISEEKDLICEKEEPQDERDELLEQLFFKEEKQPEGKNRDTFKRKIICLLPVGGALFLSLYLFFNFWTMSEIMLAAFAVIIIILLGLGILFYWKFGRNIIEINPLMQEELPDQEMYSKENPLSQEFDSPIVDEPEGTTILNTVFDEKCSFFVRKDTGQRFPLKENVVIIGKNQEMAQILLSEPTVSRIHAMITVKDNEYYLQDLNSKNGTYINGCRLESQKAVPVLCKDEIHIANIPCYLQL